MNPFVSQILIPILITIITNKLIRFNDNHRQILDIKLKIYSDIVYEINSFNFMLNDHKDLAEKITYKNILVRLFSSARLIGSNEVVNELREYFSLIGEYYDAPSEDLKKIVLDKITKSAMELEQLMRSDLCKKRHLSKIELFLHNVKN